MALRVNNCEIMFILFSEVAQRSEQWSYKPLVVSSILTFAINFFGRVVYRGKTPLARNANYI